MVARVLITTALESTWPKDRKKPVLFLGEWCKLYRRKNKWQVLDAKTLNYHWDDRKKLINDYEFLLDIHENFLVELTDILNSIHNTHHSVRYWRILIGPWLGWFVQIVFDRWSMLKKAIEEENINQCLILSRNADYSVSNDMSNFSDLILNDDTNELIYAQLLKMCWQDKIDIKTISRYEKPSKNIENSDLTWQEKYNKETTSGFKNTFKNKFRRLIPIFNRIGAKDDGYFFISSYLPLITDFRLQWRLGQFPKLWKTPQTPLIEFDMNFRNWSMNINMHQVDSFKSIVAKLIPMHMPKIYLEGYKDLKSISDKLPWPIKPKVIFTGTLWSTTEVFKMWTAEKTELGVPLVIGQHGGHFGTSPFAFAEDHQIKISDKWISWGWKDYSRPKVTPIGNLKGFGLNVKNDPKGFALLVEYTAPRYSYSLFAVAIAGQFIDYLEDQKVFLNSLSDSLRKKVLVRANNTDYDWDLPQRLFDSIPNVKLDYGHQNIRDLIKKSRIYISTYNATTFLESMAWNIPTIIFWNEEHWELSEDAMPFFELLKSVGIFHDSPYGAAKHLSNIWDNIEDWWLLDSVQEARLVFCNQYSKNPTDPLGELEIFFRDL